METSFREVSQKARHPMLSRPSGRLTEEIFVVEKASSPICFIVEGSMTSESFPQ